jgi:hypothetical protein
MRNESDSISDAGNHYNRVECTVTRSVNELSFMFHHNLVYSVAEGIL